MKDEDNDFIEDGLPQKATEATGASPSMKKTPSDSGDRRWWALIGLVVIVIVVGVVAGTSVLWKDKNDKETPGAELPESTDSPDNGNEPDTVPPRLYTSTGGPFNVTLNLFGSRILEVSNSASENEKAFEEGLINAAQFLLNTNIITNINTNFCPHCRGDAPPVELFPEIDATFEDPMVETTVDTTAGDDLNDYGTNNQEDGVEEGDLIVSDGNYVYAAYGDYLVIWEARTLQMVSSLQMPPISSLEGELKETEEQKEDLISVEDPDEQSKEARSDMLYPGIPYYADPYIQSLLLYQNRLVVIVGGYGNYYRTSTDRSSTVLYDYLATHVRIYDTSPLQGTVAGGQLATANLVSTRDVNGRFTAIRAIGQNVHLVTTSGIDTYTDLLGPLSPYNYPDYSEEEYAEYVQRAAEEKHIPAFVESLKRELSVVTGELPSLPTICMWQTEASGGEAEEYAYPDGILQTLTQVHSFDILVGESGNGEEVSLDVSISGVFLPSHWSEVYAATDTLVVAGQGWDYNPDTFESKESTYLVGMALQDATSSPHSIGKLDGYILNSRSLDVVDNVLRVATSIQNRMWFREPVILEDSELEQDIFEDSTTQEDEQDESSTQNYVTLLELPGAQDGETGDMVELGKLKLGKPNELFTAVRFFDNIAYAVTFERIDPFYVLNLNDPRNPKITAELSITGFSEYLHSMNEDNTLILALGQEADEEGQILGMKITIFDMATPESPKVRQNYVIENESNVWSSSAALWDFKAIRYVANQLIIPLSIHSWDEKSSIDNFNGFETYYVSEELIEKKCRIRHENESEDQCFHCGSSLAQRSMIFSGDVMTTDAHFVRLTDMDTCEERTKLDVSVGDDCTVDGGGCFWFW